MLRCPLCRKEQPIFNRTFCELFREHYPKGAMLLECCGPRCEGFCLATWKMHSGPSERKKVKPKKLAWLKRSVRRWIEDLEDSEDSDISEESCEETLWDHNMTYLPAVNYIHLLEDDPTSSVPEESFNLGKLFDVLAQRAQCSESANRLLMESAGEDVPLRMFDF